MKLQTLYVLALLLHDLILSKKQQQINDNFLSYVSHSCGKFAIILGVSVV